MMVNGATVAIRVILNSLNPAIDLQVKISSAIETRLKLPAPCAVMYVPDPHPMGPNIVVR
ncbi:hypothetical protein NBRC116495_12150 [Aurantivibrio plasticivorans]